MTKPEKFTKQNLLISSPVKKIAKAVFKKKYYEQIKFNIMKKLEIILCASLFCSTTAFAQNTVKIEAESHAASSGVETKKQEDGSVVVKKYDKGKWIKFNGVDLTGVTAIRFRAASGASSKKANLEIRLDEKDSQPIAKGAVKVKDWGVFNVTTVTLNGVTGTHDLFIASPDGGVVLDWLELIK